MEGAHRKSVTFLNGRVDVLSAYGKIEQSKNTTVQGNTIGSEKSLIGSRETGWQ